MAQKPGPILGYSQYGEPIYGPPTQRNTGMVVALVGMGALLVVVLAVSGVFFFVTNPFTSSTQTTVAGVTPAAVAPLPSTAPTSAPAPSPAPGPQTVIVVPANPPAAPAPTYQAPARTSSGYTVAGADSQGFTSYGPRCNSTNPAVAIGRTAKSKIVVCQTGVGRYYYKGMRLSDGAPIEISDPVPNGSGYTATNGAVGYRVSAAALTITQNGAVVTSEPMLDYWSS